MVNTQPAFTYLPKKIQSIHNYEILMKILN